MMRLAVVWNSLLKSALLARVLLDHGSNLRGFRGELTAQANIGAVLSEAPTSAKRRHVVVSTNFDK
jgi:hypothetical protein